MWKDGGWRRETGPGSTGAWARTGPRSLNRGRRQSSSNYDFTFASNGGSSGSAIAVVGAGEEGSDWAASAVFSTDGGLSGPSTVKVSSELGMASAYAMDRAPERSVAARQAGSDARLRGEGTVTASRVAATSAAVAVASAAVSPAGDRLRWRSWIRSRPSSLRWKIGRAHV